MIIGFWSETAGKGATTCNMLATALAMAARCDKRLVLMQGKYDENRIDNAFIPFLPENVMREDYGYYQYGGMDYLLGQAGQRRLHAGDIERELIQAGDANLYYLPAARQRTGALFDRQFKKIADAYMDALAEFDRDTVVLIELGSGLETLTGHMLEALDVLVVNIAQEYHAIRQLSDNRALMEQSLYIVGRYDEASRLNVRNLSRRHRIDAQRIGVVPYHTGFKDAVSMGKSMRFFEKNCVLYARKNYVWDSLKYILSDSERKQVPDSEKLPVKHFGNRHGKNLSKNAERDSGNRQVVENAEIPAKESEESPVTEQEENAAQDNGRNHETVLFMKNLWKTSQMIMERCGIDVYGRVD